VRVVNVADQQAEPGCACGTAVLTMLVSLVRHGQQEEIVSGPGAELEGRDVLVEGRVERGLMELSGRAWRLLV
jgi:hypothetical protein